MARLNKSRRYSTSHLPEDQTEPGSGRRVLRNLLGIKSQGEMDQVEARELKRTEDVLFRTYDQSHHFTASDICHMHELWLGKVYGWAGQYRQVKLSKGNFSFAFPAQIPQLMSALDPYADIRHAGPGRERASSRSWQKSTRNGSSSILFGRETEG